MYEKVAQCGKHIIHMDAIKMTATVMRGSEKGFVIVETKTFVSRGKMRSWANVMAQTYRHVS